ncbi:hypothetical protein IWX49DRAFT_55309 [Phyllosticta citricarpa]|uniref:Secreted protein n=2 Tax=Phyllosticta TaxID=121621 RepID=A0ABR1MPB1_9PEZI
MLFPCQRDGTRQRTGCGQMLATLFFSFRARSALALSTFESSRSSPAWRLKQSTNEDGLPVAAAHHIHTRNPRRNGSTELSFLSKHRTSRGPRGASARSDCSAAGAICILCLIQPVVLLDLWRLAAEGLLANGGSAGTLCYRSARSHHDVRRQLSVF